MLLLTYSRFITLFLSVFIFCVSNESTVRGLNFYGKNYQECLDAAKYVEFILNLWKVMSLKTPSKDKVNKN